jgi:hypothetical protein
MKRTAIVVLSVLLAPPLFADAGQHLIPAGTLVSCNTGDARISSSSTAVGDPVLCKVERRFGNMTLPYGSVLGGTFADFKDPGHFVGKGFMQLDFDRLYVGDTVIPIEAKVVDVPGYRIDPHGRILGKGHAVRDTITWMIPILWPIDLIELPRRGPRPTLKSETQLTLRVMEDTEVPVTPEPQRDPYGLIPRGGQSYAPQPEPPAQQPQDEPQLSYAPPDEPPAQPDYGYVPPPSPAPVLMAPMVVAPPPMVAYGSFYVGPRWIAPRPLYGYRGGWVAARAYGRPYGYAGGRAWAYGGSGRMAGQGMGYRSVYRGR